MGDMADYYFDRELDHWPRDPEPKACRMCGRRSLWWAETKTGWRLVEEDGTPHRCKVEFDPEPS